MRRRSARRRAPAVLGLVAAWLLAGAAPAIADPAGPTHYDSVVTSVETVEGEAVDVEAEVLGGDAFLVLRVPPATRAEVPGYDGEPYLRIAEDGTVEVNHRSPTHWFNEDRYGADVPEVADVEATPVWREVADSGAYAWHEHRIHWMSPDPPRQVDTAVREVQVVFDWQIPLRVDDREVVVRGELAWYPGPPVWMPALLVVLALGLAGALVFLLRIPVAALAAVGGVAAAVAGLAQVTGQPPGGEGEPFVVALPVLAAGAAGLALLLGRREPGSGRARLLGAASGLPLLVWGVLQAGALTRPIAPEPMTGASLRPLAAAALGIGAVSVVWLVREGVRRLPDPLSETPGEAAAEGR